METVHSVAYLIQPPCYMISIGLVFSEGISKWLKMSKTLRRKKSYQMDCIQVHQSSQSLLHYPLHV